VYHEDIQGMEVLLHLFFTLAVDSSDLPLRKDAPVFVELEAVTRYMLQEI
jgi:hypothetical protein